jgi:hypothetical protein
MVVALLGGHNCVVLRPGAAHSTIGTTDDARFTIRVLHDAVYVTISEYEKGQ